MKSYSLDLKTRVVNYYRTNRSTVRAVSTIFAVSPASVNRWVNGVHMNSSPPPREYPSKYAIVVPLLKILLQNDPACMLKIMVSKISSEHHINIGKSSLSEYLKSINYSRKKFRKRTITNNNTPEIKTAFKEQMMQRGYDNIISLDEVGFQLNMMPGYGRSAKGSRCTLNSTRRGHINYSAIFAVSTTGVVNWQLYDSAINGEKFIDYLNNSKQAFSNRHILMDNLRLHHSHVVLDLLAANNSVPIFTPPYSPELNPVEELFSMLKRHLRYNYVSNLTELRHHLTVKVAEINQRGLVSLFNHAFSN